MLDCIGHFFLTLIGQASHTTENPGSTILIQVGSCGRTEVATPAILVHGETSSERFSLHIVVALTSCLANLNLSRYTRLVFWNAAIWRWPGSKWPVRGNRTSASTLVLGESVTTACAHIASMVSSVPRWQSRYSCQNMFPSCQKSIAIAPKSRESRRQLSKVQKGLTTSNDGVELIRSKY